MIPAYIAHQLFSGTASAASTVLYNKNSWINLNDFTYSGGFAVTGNKIVSPANNTDYIRFEDATALDAYVLEFQVKWLANNAGNGIFGVKMVTVNTTSAQGNEIYFGGTSNPGKIVGYRQSSGITTVSANALTPAVGDVITMRIEKLLTGYTNIKITIGANSISETMYLLSNTSRITIPAQLNTYEIQSVKWTTPYRIGIDRMGFGDSITVGANADDIVLRRWAALAKMMTSAGLGDKTNEGVLRLRDVTTRVKPKKLFVLLGTNDLSAGISASAWQANYNSIYSAVSGYGGKCIFLLPLPRNSADISAYKNWIIANYPSNYIDTYTPMLGSGTGLNAAYDSGDGLHPNNAGHQKIADTILSSTLY